MEQCIERGGQLVRQIYALVETVPELLERDLRRARLRVHEPAYGCPKLSLRSAVEKTLHIAPLGTPVSSPPPMNVAVDVAVFRHGEYLPAHRYDSLPNANLCK